MNCMFKMICLLQERALKVVLNIQYTNMSYAKFSQNYKCLITSLKNLYIHRNVAEAMGDMKWVKGMKEEIKEILKNKIWEVVGIPNNSHPAGVYYQIDFICKNRQIEGSAGCKVIQLEIWN